jgi:hypothetical protein
VELISLDTALLVLRLTQLSCKSKEVMAPSGCRLTYASAKQRCAVRGDSSGRKFVQIARVNSTSDVLNS